SHVASGRDKYLLYCYHGSPCFIFDETHRSFTPKDRMVDSRSYGKASASETQEDTEFCDEGKEGHVGDIGAEDDIPGIVVRRTVPGYIRNPTSVNRSGKWFQLMAVNEQLPAQGVEKDQYVVEQHYRAKSMHFIVVFDFDRFGASNLPWRVMLVKMAPRVQATFAPTSETLVSLYHYSQTANGTGYVKMTEQVIGKIDADFGRVIWNKAVPKYADNTNLGSAVVASRSYRWQS
ncbi:hypothetical protein T492DRAFT_1135552, partial [Pavlovales sp. CCMP2436]